MVEAVKIHIVVVICNGGVCKESVTEDVVPSQRCDCISPTYVYAETVRIIFSILVHHVSATIGREIESVFVRESVINLQIQVVELIAVLVVLLHERLREPLHIGCSPGKVERRSILYYRPLKLHSAREQTN